MYVLADTDDLADMWRPLEADEIERARNLIDKASALLRQAAPSVDDRIAAWQRDQSDPRGLDPTVVATVVATVVKRFISNVEGIATQSVNGFAVSYALRTEKTIRGELQITQDDLKALFPNRKRLRAGMIRTRPALAPRPVGRYGGIPGPHQMVDAMVTWRQPVVFDANNPEYALPPDLLAE